MIWTDGTDSLDRSPAHEEAGWCEKPPVCSGRGVLAFVVQVNRWGAGKRNKVGKDERNHRKMIDLSGCSAELLSQLPPILGLGRPLVAGRWLSVQPCSGLKPSSRSTGGGQLSAGCLSGLSSWAPLMPGDRKQNTFLPEFGTTLKSRFSPRVPVRLAETSVVMTLQFSFACCLVLLPSRPDSCSGEGSPSHFLHANLRVSVCFQEPQPQVGLLDHTGDKWTPNVNGN